MKRKANIIVGVCIGAVLLCAIGGCTCEDRQPPRPFPERSGSEMTPSPDDAPEVRLSAIHATLTDSTPTSPIVTVYKTPNLESWEAKSWDGMPYREGRVSVTGQAGNNLVVFLHGKNGEGTDNWRHHTMEHGHYQILNYLERTRTPGIVLMPQCPKGQTWTQPQMAGRLKALIDHYAASDSIDEKRIYICGTSNGAIGV